MQYTIFRQVIVGSGKGRMNLIDLRKEGKILNSYKGSAGSITGIAINKNEDNVISIGFDRTLRIHDINTKLILKKVILFIYRKMFHHIPIPIYFKQLLQFTYIYKHNLLSESYSRT